VAYPWTPTADDVALYVPQRVSDVSGTFSNTTVPSITAVERLAARAAEDVYAAVGSPPDNLLNAASHVAALGTAVQIEESWTSNEAEEKSPRLVSLSDRYEKALARLKTAVQEGAGETVPSAAFGFPDLSTTDQVPSGQFTGGMSWSTDF
jgi:hypothetical protein